MPEDFEADDMMEESPAPSKPKKGKSKLLVIGIPVVLIQLIAAYFLVNLFLKPEMPEKENVVEIEKPAEKTKFGVEFLITDMTINIPTTERRTRYFVADVGFECETQAVADEITKRLIQIKDVVIGTVMSKSLEQLSSNQFVEDTLKIELREKINEKLMSGIVQNVYFPSRIIN